MNQCVWLCLCVCMRMSGRVRMCLRVYAYVQYMIPMPRYTPPCTHTLSVSAEQCHYYTGILPQDTNAVIICLNGVPSRASQTLQRPLSSGPSACGCLCPASVSLPPGVCLCLFKTLLLFCQGGRVVVRESLGCIWH